MADQRTYDLDNIPDDAMVYASPMKEFDPIDPGEIYQVHCDKVELRDNIYYKPDEEDPAKRGSKYQLSFEYTILTEGAFLGRKLWDNTGLALGPTTKRGSGGPTKLYKIVACCIGTQMDWDECSAFAPDATTLLRNLLEVVQGHQLRVAVENSVNPKTQKTRTKITSYSAIKKELGVPVKEEVPHPAETAE